MTDRQKYKSIYWCWKSMKQRCQNPKCKAYHNYGARGITICDEWQNFDDFLSWVLSSNYQKGLELDRINNNEGYNPNNCRWITRKENVNNRRKTIYLTVNNETKARTEWENILNLPKGILKAWVSIHGKEYAELRLITIIKEGYKEKDYSYKHKKKVKHVETGLIFDSVKDAAEYFNIAACTISNSIRNNRKTHKGKFNYEIVERIAS